MEVPTLGQSPLCRLPTRRLSTGNENVPVFLLPHEAEQQAGNAVIIMINKPVALIQVPNRRLFSMAAEAQCVRKAIDTIRKLADLNIIKARVELDTAGRRRSVFALENVNA